MSIEVYDAGPIRVVRHGRSVSASAPGPGTYPVIGHWPSGCTLNVAVSSCADSCRNAWTRLHGFVPERLALRLDAATNLDLDLLYRAKLAKTDEGRYTPRKLSTEEDSWLPTSA